MIPARRQFLQLAACAAAIPAVPRRAAAQSYPARSVRIVVGFTAGGSTDIGARLIGQWLQDRLGQPFVIENRPGAATNIATESVVRAPPDGYTLLMGPASVYAISATLYPRLGYDLVKDLTPVSLVANVPHVLLVNNDLPVKSVPELVQLAKKRPGQLNIASQGSGTVSHLEAELLKHMAGIDMLHVPYRGSAPAILDLIGGRVQVMFDSIASALPHVRAGKLRAIAVASNTRSSLLPNVPTVAESLPGYSAHSWLGIFVPAGTPQSAVERLQRDLVAAIDDPKAQARLVEAGFEPKSSSQGDFAELVREEMEKWRSVVKMSGATPD
jgi:tripartite-type tricarboxylate transporter receptor subunit TctC